MKKITLLVLFIGMITLQSCTINDNDTDNIDNDTISEVIEISNVDFNSFNNYNVLVTINPAIYASDMILVYRLDSVYQGQDVWRLMPQTYYFNNGDEIDYNFDFTSRDVSIFMGGNFDLNLADFSWTQNQVFRIVIVPGYFGNKMSNTDFSNYKQTVNKLGLDKKEIKKIKL